MDYQSVASPTNYGAPSVFGQGQQPAQGQQQNGQQGQQPQMGPQTSALLAKAKQLLSSGQISADQYSQVAAQAQQAGNSALPYSGGNMGGSMPGAPQAGAPVNILPTG